MTKEKNLRIGSKELRYHFEAPTNQNPVLSIGYDLASCFELMIPDTDGQQLDRLPLPENLHTEHFFKEIYRQATMRYRGKLINDPEYSRNPDPTIGKLVHDPVFPQFSFEYRDPETSKPQAVWVKRLAA